ncbi:MAG: thiamine-monophosphate kinase [Sedimentisphaerales bacterium]|nr:thiamine-monophosphate kinase [Sedimentisphaerales bacterium]MBN2844272.1 thiamine-monophosphate kinase [Sedimentisphaerales bacterium]
MPKEFEIIDYFRSQSCGSGEYIETGPGDDMAVMNINSQRLLVTTDMLLDGVHFDSTTTDLTRIGYKAMATSLSDCAAMCSRPVGCVAAISLPRHYNMKEITSLHNGFKMASQQYNCPIIGGDMTSWDKDLTLTVTMFSIMENSRQPIYRHGAQPGDKIMVTGQLGGSILGRHLDFTPRINEAIWLYDHCKLHAMMDISDGIGGDLRHICRESRVSALLYGEQVPISPSAHELGGNPLLHALTDGEDFELLFTVKASDAERLLSIWPQFSSEKLSIIGEIIPVAEELIYLKNNGETTPFTQTGYEH